MKNLIPSLTLLLIFVLALAACQAAPESASTTGGAATITIPSNWNLVEFGPAGQLKAPLAGSSITLDFNKDGLGGNSSCNNYGGQFEIKGDQLVFSQLFSTLMACDQPLMDQETAYLQILSSPMTIKVEGNRLTLTGANGVLVFETAGNLALEGTAWQLSGIATGQAVVSTWVDENINAQFSGGQVSGSAGCNNYFAPYTLDGARLTIGPAGMTKMFCENQEVMQREAEFALALERVASYEIVRNSLNLLDAQGSLVMSFTAK